MIRLTTSTSFLAALFLLLIVNGLARAAIITTGDVEPGGSNTQADPWAVENDLTVDV